MIYLKKTIWQFCLLLFIAAGIFLINMPNAVGADEKPATPVNTKIDTKTEIVKLPVLKNPIISNGDFEKDANDDNWPDDWGKGSGISWESEDPDAKPVADPAEPGEIKVDPDKTTEVKKLNHFIRMVGNPGKLVMLYRLLPVPDGVKAVELTWRQHMKGLKVGSQSWFDARIMFEFKDANGNKLKHNVGAPYTRSNSNDWVKRSTKILLPEGAKTIEFMPCLFQVQAGTIDMDDFVMTPIDDEPLKIEAKKRAEEWAVKIEKEAEAKQNKADKILKENGSLIINGNFELDNNADKWPDDWGKGNGISYESEGEGDAANHYLRMKSTEPDKTVMICRTFDLPKDTKALEFSWKQQISDLKVGKEAWYDARIMLKFQDASGKEMSHEPGAPYSRGNSKGWESRKIKFLIPEKAVTLVMMPCLFNVVSGIFDLDDLTLKPIDADALIAKKKTADEIEKASRVPVEKPIPKKWAKELHVKGNQVLDTDNKQVILQGVNVDSLEYLVQGDHVMKTAIVAVDDWKSKIIRLPVKDEFWYGKGPGQKDGGAAYRELVDNVITLITNRGSYVLLDLHRFLAPSQAQVTFWTDASTKYKNHPGVLFDLFNEPHGTSWEIWRNGGFVEDKNAPADEDAFLTPEEKALNAKGFHAVGMQKLVDAVRATGAKNIVICGGLDWSYDLTGIKDFALEDKTGNGIIYATHIYPWKFQWKEKVLCIADKYPILVGEVGADIKKMDFIPDSAQEDPYTWCPDVLGFMQKNKLSWTAWCFHLASSPRMILDWNYTPTPFWGAFVKRTLAGEQFEMKKMR
ncbi:MAG: cellulase family glycosylhydrolase [bacterium]